MVAVIHPGCLRRGDLYGGRWFASACWGDMSVAEFWGGAYILRGVFEWSLNLTSASHEFFASINKIFILAGGLCTGLSFYEI